MNADCGNYSIYDIYDNYGNNNSYGNNGMHGICGIYSNYGNCGDECCDLYMRENTITVKRWVTLWLYRQISSCLCRDSICGNPGRYGNYGNYGSCGDGGGDLYVRGDVEWGVTMLQ